MFFGFNPHFNVDNPFVNDKGFRSYVSDLYDVMAKRAQAEGLKPKMEKETFVDRMMKDVASKPREADQIEATKQRTGAAKAQLPRCRTITGSCTQIAAHLSAIDCAQIRAGIILASKSAMNCSCRGLASVALGHVPGKIGLGRFEDRDDSGDRFTYFFFGVGW